MKDLFSFFLLFFQAVFCSPRTLLRLRVIKGSTLLDPHYYISQLNPSERRYAKYFPTAHYLLIGEPRNLNPNPLFLTSYYRGQMQRNGQVGSPILHYLTSGATGAIMPNPQFNGAMYLNENVDVALHRFNPLAHYYWSGFKEDRRVPGPTFNQRSYLNRFPTLKDFSENPLAHYLTRETERPTELWGLEPGEALPPISARDPRTLSTSLSVELLIPVYRKPDCVEALLESLVRSDDWSLIAKVTFIDDCGDSYTSKYLQDLKKRSPKIQVIVNPKNLGFLASCNNAYMTTTSDIVVLVNTDIRLPRNWLLRMLRPLAIDAKVALVTPLATNGANLSVSLRPGQSWVDADKIISASPPKYPDACTAVGYVMAIRKKAISSPNLFDTIFEHGYCEDTDLHYRLIQDGWRSVICDDLLVFHQGSASYELDSKKTLIYENNRKIFFDRWLKIHVEQEKKYLAANPLKDVLTPATYTRFEQKNQTLDLLFISPTNDTTFGGVRIIFELAVYLNERGLKCAILSHEHTAPVLPQTRDLIMPYFTKELLEEQVTAVKLLVGTGLGVHKILDKLAQHYTGSELIWLLQGPEGYFERGEYYYVFKDYLRKSTAVIAVSEYLAQFARFLGVKNAVAVPLGPNPQEFYQRDVERDPKAVAIHIINTPDKGARFCIPFAERLIQLGANVHFFGSGSLANSMPKSIGTWHGRLNSDGLAKLFSQCTYYLDLSVMEGLGLLPLEAAFCGCRPVMTKKGAPDLIFDDSNVTWLESHFVFNTGAQKLLAAPPLESAGIQKLRSKYSTYQAFEGFYNAVKDKCQMSR